LKDYALRFSGAALLDLPPV